MLFEKLLKTERKEERVETIIELLEDLGTLPENLKERLESERNFMQAIPAE